MDVHERRGRRIDAAGVEGERLVGLMGTVGHVSDIGGTKDSLHAREIFEEGLQIPPMKMIAAGRTDETLVTIIRKNVRTPDQTMGDLWAQVVALGQAVVVPYGSFSDALETKEFSALEPAALRYLSRGLFDSVKISRSLVASMTTSEPMSRSAMVLVASASSMSGCTV